MSQHEQSVEACVLPLVCVGFLGVMASVVYLLRKRFRVSYTGSPIDPLETPTNLVDIRTASERVPMHNSGYYNFTPDIFIRTLNGRYIIAAAALDTQCQEGNWVSKRLIEELGLLSSVHHEHQSPQVITATGEEVESYGSIDLVWKLAPNENRVYRGKFFVLSNVRHLDVILGQDTINKEAILAPNSQKLFATLTAHGKLTKADRAAIAASEAKQQQDKQSLEARRRAAQQQQSSSQTSNQQQQSSNPTSN
ncbi:hypothetical protein K491DRAFT_688839 [Lophiostoma macrostomum CBS 122681]|uniref:Uncharacterized protein n=1 Tax=Lophiostoma macrostomum CBS 122681 TaxID=1314788 RepID=A0A6A6TIY5_9PLEO|nr:hypothetical protein K491DRAFT_688839 [Lophiostoma macrostomum CBS 122681]